MSDQCCPSQAREEGKWPRTKWWGLLWSTYQPPQPPIFTFLDTLPTLHPSSVVDSNSLWEMNNSNLRYKNINPAYLIVVSPQLECFGEVCPLKIVLFLSITMIWSDLIYLHQRKHILFLFRNSIFRPSRLNDWSKSTFDCKNGSQYTITFTQLNVRHHHLRCHGWWLL